MKTNLFAVLLCTVFLVASTQAELVFTMVETGGDVVVTSGIGSLDLTDLFLLGPGVAAFSSGAIVPKEPNFFNGQTGGRFDRYGSTTFTGSFGGGGFSTATSASGPGVGMNVGDVWVSAGYTSGSTIAATSSTYAGATFASLGVTEGTYVWSWGDSPSTSDSITLNIGQVPEPTSLLTFGIGCMLLARRRRR